MDLVHKRINDMEVKVKTYPDIVTATTSMRKFARGRVKCAEDVPDSSFEQAFSNIAHATLKDRAPSLLDFEVGFQLIDRNEENTKAIGVFGFKVGSQWLYAPVFFLNGELKGKELLYIKNQDLFVPMKENWLNYILNRRPNVLGSSVDRNLTQIGVMPPHLYQLSRSPYKFAAVVCPECKEPCDENGKCPKCGKTCTEPDKLEKKALKWTKKMSSWVKEALPDLAYFATTHPRDDKKYKDLIDLPTFLKKEGRVVIKALVRGFEAEPKLAEFVDQFHGLAIIDEAIESINASEKAAASKSVICDKTPAGVRCFNTKKPRPNIQAQNEVNTEPGDLIKAGDEYSHLTGLNARPVLKPKIPDVYTYDEVMDGGTYAKNLTDKDREKLLKDKVVIKDDREDKDVSIAYETQTPTRLQNPGETGLYDVLVRENKFEKCVIVFAPYNQKERKEFITLVKLEGEEGGRAWLNIHPGHIWVGYQYPNKDYQKWFDGLPKVKELPVSRKGLHILIGNTYEGTLPFVVDKEISTGDRKIYDVWFKSHCEKGRPYHLPPLKYGGESQQWYDRQLINGGDDFGSRIVLTGKRGPGMRATGSDLYVPNDYRLLTLRPAQDDDDGLMGMCGCDAHSEPSPIQPGNQFDIDLLIGTKTAAMKIYHTGTEVDINGLRTTKIGALIHLVRDHGLREKTARMLLQRAEQKKVARCRIKYANGLSEKRAVQDWEMQKSGPTAPPHPDPYIGFDPITGNNIPTQQLSEFNVKIPDMMAAKTDRSIYYPLGPDPDYQQAAPDRKSQQAAMQAGASGQKEVFDTSMISGLLKAVRDDSMVDKYLGDLMKGLDRLGRILFLFYWHGEKFEERYGKGEMVELEDGLRNAFESLGDLVLFLKQRSIDPHPDEVPNVDLKSVADQ